MGDEIRVVAAVIEREGRYLITQRRESAVLPLLWEFPGGKVEVGESDLDALRREVRVRLGADVLLGERIGERRHQYDGYAVVLVLYAARLAERAVPRALRVREFRWVASTEFGDYQFPPADQHTMDQLLGVQR